jgi:tetratricopeptide (TPR) repeat protein
MRESSYLDQATPTAVPLFAQQAEYDSLQMFVPRDQIKTLVEY